MDNTFFPPLQYDFMWIILAGSVLFVAIVFYVFLFIMTRKLKHKKDIMPLPKGLTQEEALSLIKNKYAENIMTVSSKYKTGEITSKQAFQSLSIHLRNFSHEYSATGAYSMTLKDLNDKKAAPSLRKKIEDFYPYAFERAEKEGNVALAVKDALEVIQLWH